MEYPGKNVHFKINHPASCPAERSITFLHLGILFGFVYGTKRMMRRRINRKQL